MPNKYDELVEQALGMPNLLPQDILDIHGMSGHLFRSFLNNLIALMHKPRYLEIGCWKGSTAISALYENIKKVDKYWIIDDWSEFEGPRKEFIEGFVKFIDVYPNLLDVDCFSINPQTFDIQDVNIYFYDGGHTAQDHQDALEKYIDCMADEFIYIVDDWNADIVRLPTLDVIKRMPIETVYFKEIFTNWDEKYTWWNGVGIFVFKKHKNITNINQ